MNFPRQTGVKPPKRRKRKLRKHGVYALKAALTRAGSGAIDRRTKLGKALAAWVEENINDLGGPENVSVRQLDVIEMAVRSKLLLASIDHWILEQGEAAIIHKSKRCLFPIIAQRQAVANGLLQALQALGLERRGKPEMSLDEYLQQFGESKDEENKK